MILKSASPSPTSSNCSVMCFMHAYIILYIIVYKGSATSRQVLGIILSSLGKKRTRADLEGRSFGKESGIPLGNRVISSFGGSKVFGQPQKTLSNYSHFCDASSFQEGRPHEPLLARFPVQVPLPTQMPSGNGKKGILFWLFEFKGIGTLSKKQEKSGGIHWASGRMCPSPPLPAPWDRRRWLVKSMKAPKTPKKPT